MVVTLYTTYCPKCKVLETKLNEKKIPYNVVDNMAEMILKGFLEAPKLEVNGELMNFVEAINWIKTM